MAAPTLDTLLRSPRTVDFRTFEGDHSERHASCVHDHGTLVLYLGGRATFWMQGLYGLGRGDVLLVPPGTPHQAVEARDVRCVGLSLDLEGIPGEGRSVLKGLFGRVRRGESAVRHLEDPGPLLSHLTALEEELEHPGPEHRLAVGACLASMAVLLVRAGPGAPSTASLPPLVASVLEIVEEQATSGLSLREVARQVGRSPNHVADVVRAKTGESVVGWITHARLARARQLLLQSDANIDQVANRCGFASPSHFHRAFKRAHGLPPGTWRRRHQELPHVERDVQ